MPLTRTRDILTMQLNNTTSSLKIQRNEWNRRKAKHKKLYKPFFSNLLNLLALETSTKMLVLFSKANADHFISERYSKVTSIDLTQPSWFPPTNTLEVPYPDMPPDIEWSNKSLEKRNPIQLLARMVSYIVPSISSPIPITSWLLFITRLLLIVMVSLHFPGLDVTSLWSWRLVVQRIPQTSVL